ncbi:MAG: hypothetical protein V3V20_04985 [Algisphaera sp.]
MPPHQLACPRCHKPCRWTPQRAGRRVRCTCSQTFRVPQTPDGAVIPDNPPDSPPDTTSNAPYNLEHTPPPSHTTDASSNKCPSCNSSLRPGAVICMNCGYNTAAGEKIKTQIETDADEGAEGQRD